MGKLSGIKPRLGGLSSRLGVSRKAKEQVRLEQRDSQVGWRAWYKTARWKDLRQKVLVRDRFICQKTGVILVGKYPAPDSPTVHHKMAHRGDPVLFWDHSNLEAVSKEWHDKVAQAIEKAEHGVAVRPEWLKPSLVPITIVSGPPASGKSTYAKANAGPHDLVIDLDDIASEISGQPVHGWDDAYLNAAIYRRNDILGSLSRPSPYGAAWLIVSEAKAEHRKWWQEKLGARAVIVMETSEAECIDRLQSSGRNNKKIEDAIVKWWFEYSRRPGETPIKADCCG